MYDEVIERLRKIENNEPDEWVKAKDNDMEKLFYRQEPGSPCYTFFAERVVTADFINAACVIKEYE